MTAKRPTCADVAARIDVHLRRIEKDRKLNPIDPVSGTSWYFNAWAQNTGSRVRIQYVSYQGNRTVSLTEAIAYLEWLDAGNVGTFYSMAHG